ncbi:methyl-accepting chemotaxis protein [Niallia sp. 01092]|uniref:methyl-accepting chemotaxis protein n=1 Tax=unclassified Niallia TaxID=2837522 RepID=UPI003FD26F6A
MNLSIKQKLIGSFLLISLLFGIAAFNSYTNAKKTDEAYNYVINTVIETRSITEQIHTNIALQTSYYQGYMLNHNSEDKNQLNEASATIQSLVEKGKKLATIQETRDRLAEIERVNDQYVEIANSSMDRAANKEGDLQNDLKQMDALSNNLTDQIESFKTWLKDERLNPVLTKTKKDSQTRITYMIIFSVSATALAIIIGLTYSLFLSNTLNKLKDATKKVAEGNLNIEEITIKSKDELFELNESFNQMKHNLTDMIQNISANSDHVAASAEQLNASAEQSSKASETIASSIQQIASGNEFTTSSIQTNTQNVAYILENILKISQDTKFVSELSQTATHKAEEGTVSVQNNLSQMEFIQDSVTRINTVITSLSERSKEIGNILTIISSIAEQTNLLALNAAIEAARAGEHGKGFSIVADEVRKLAEQSQTSAKSIAELILAIQKETQESVTVLHEAMSTVQNGVEISKETAQTFSEILNSTKNVTPKIEQVTETLSDITKSVKEVDSIANEIVTLSKQNAADTDDVAASTEEQLASMQEITASAEELARMAEELTGLVGRFKL